LPVPLLVVDVLGDALGVVAAVLLGLVELELLGVVVLEGDVSVLVLLDGVHGATVLVVPVWFCMLPPVTDPALPATPGVPCVTAGLPVLVLGCDVGRVPTDPGWDAPGCVVAPGCVAVVPGCDCVVEVPVCGPIPGLGVTVPVLCAVAKPAASTNTDDVNRILRIESCSLCTSVASSSATGIIHSQKALLHRWDAFSTAQRCRGRVAGRDYLHRFRSRGSIALGKDAGGVGQMRCFASILPPVLKIKCEFLLCKLIRNVYSNGIGIILSHQGKRFELIVNA
ncbi:MAG TPA: hypothetical protein VFK81_01555, partial [Terriglobales bacterium]|nr:hypothetical protein [Terriglobales bacterium]